MGVERLPECRSGDDFGVGGRATAEADGEDEIGVCAKAGAAALRGEIDGGIAVRAGVGIGGEGEVAAAVAGGGGERGGSGAVAGSRQPDCDGGSGHGLLAAGDPAADS